MAVVVVEAVEAVEAVEVASMENNMIQQCKVVGVVTAANSMIQ